MAGRHARGHRPREGGHLSRGQARNHRLAPDPAGKRILIAHRGVSQLFDHAGVTDTSCTATRIYPPEHPYIENSLRSLRAAVGRDAGMIKFDVAATKDGRLAVFHDWTLDCRTDGKGPIRADKRQTVLLGVPFIPTSASRLTQGGCRCEHASDGRRPCPSGRNINVYWCVVTGPGRRRRVRRCG